MTSHIGWKGEQNIFYKGVETSTWPMHFKKLEGISKEKAQRGQYLLVVGLSCYKWYQRQTPGSVPARTLSPEGGWIVRSHIEEWRTSASEDAGS